MTDKLDKELVEKCLLTYKMDEPGSDFRQFMVEWRKENGYAPDEYVEVPTEDICKAQDARTRKAVADKLYHPPIVFKDIDVSSEALAQILTKVREYYQIVFDEAVGKGEG